MNLITQPILNKYATKFHKLYSLYIKTFLQILKDLLCEIIDYEMSLSGYVVTAFLLGN